MLMQHRQRLHRRRRAALRAPPGRGSGPTFQAITNYLQATTPVAREKDAMFSTALGVPDLTLESLSAKYSAAAEQGSGDLPAHEAAGSSRGPVDAVWIARTAP